jgi:hypothetical protein
LVSISRHLALFDELGWKAITLKGLFQSSAPVHLWAAKRARIVDPTIQDFSWGLGKWHSGDMACPSKKSTIKLRVEGLS